MTYNLAKRSTVSLAQWKKPVVFIFESENFKMREVRKLWVPFVPNSEVEHRFLAFQFSYLPTQRNDKQGIRTERLKRHRNTTHLGLSLPQQGTKEGICFSKDLS